MGGARIKKKEVGPKKERKGALGLEREPNQSGSNEPDRFSIGYIKGRGRVFSHFSTSFSLFPLSRERGSVFSLESCSDCCLLPRRVGRFRRGGRRVIAAAPPRRS